MTDIVIVNWNSGDYLKKCIHSIFQRNNEEYIGNVFVIDNASEDLSISDIQIDNRIILIRNDRNVGFAKACNQGFRKCTAPYVLLLNPDAGLLSNTLRECTEYMNQDNSTDVLGCCLLDDNGIRTKSCSRFPTPARVFFDATGLSKVSPKIFTPSTIMTDWDHLQSSRVEVVMGAFMFMRSNIFKQIEYFDERFFVYYEEVDFSKRLSLAQGKIFYNASIMATHSGEGTTKSVKAFRLFLSLKSRLQYAQKHFSPAGFFLVWLSTFFIEPFSRTFFLLCKGKFSETKEVFRGFSFLIKSKQI